MSQVQLLWGPPTPSAVAQSESHLSVPDQFHSELPLKWQWNQLISGWLNSSHSLTGSLDAPTVLKLKCSYQINTTTLCENFKAFVKIYSLKFPCYNRVCFFPNLLIFSGVLTKTLSVATSKITLSLSFITLSVSEHWLRILMYSETLFPIGRQQGGLGWDLWCSKRN